MALQSPEPGSYYEFKHVCDAGALVAFHIHEHRPEEEITNRKTNRASKVQPVIADIIVLDGGTNPALAKTVVRQEKIIGRGITGSLRRVSVGNDGVFRMAWGYGEVTYPQANAVSDEDMAFAADIFAKTGNDPYSAAERAATPATLQSPAPQAAPAPVAAAPAAPAQPPAPDAPAPWGQGGNTGGNAPAPVGGPQGPGWGESPAATNAQPVASGSVW